MMQKSTKSRFGVLSVVSVLVVQAVLMVASSGVASADTEPPVQSFTFTSNMEPLGFSARPNPASGVYNSDLAFWEDTAYQGTYDGFQIIDISDPSDPQKILDYTGCSNGTSGQGDVVIWENLLARAWNSGAGSSAVCGGATVPSGWEGVHLFDVSDPTDPALIASIQTRGGAHTASGFPDLENNRFIVISSASSSGGNAGFDLIEVPLDDPAAAAVIHSEVPVPARSCHDTAVFTGAGLIGCAGGNGWALWSTDPTVCSETDPVECGSPTDPLQIHSQQVGGVSIGHAISFSSDGSTVIFGHEPGGGSQAQCQASTVARNKTVFFYDTTTFEEVGQWTLPRPQTSAENCTIHNYNVVPSARRNLLVSGNYQAGISVVDFSDRRNPVEIAYADPAPLGASLTLGGDWSSYWYDGHIYESDITRGLITWKLNDEAVEGAIELGSLNPQTQLEVIEPIVTDLAATVDATGSTSLDDAIGYSVTVTNEGPLADPDVRVGSDLPAALEFDPAGSDPSCEHDGSAVGGRVTCAIGPLGVGESGTVNFGVVARAAGFIDNTITAFGANMDQNATNSRITVGTIVNPFDAVIAPDVVVDGDTATVSGTASFPTITAPESVGGTKTAFNAQTLAAGKAAGLELVGGKVFPIEDGLRFIWEVTDLPEATPGSPPEASRYVWTMMIGANTYQLEAKRSGAVTINAIEDLPGHLQRSATPDPTFRLRGDCESSYEGAPIADCHFLAPLTGTFDYANNQVTIDWPFETQNSAGEVVAADFVPGVALTHCGSCATTESMSIAGSFQLLRTTNNTALSNYINGWSMYFVGPQVHLAVGPRGVNPTTLEYGPAIALTDNSFTGQVAGLVDNKDTVYARACVGLSCSYATKKVR